MLHYGTAKYKFYFGLFCLSLVLIIGCRDFWPFAPEKVAYAPSPTELKQYRQALEAYEQKAYFDAIRYFEAIRTQTRDKRLARMALYGLAVSRLMAAKTPKEYKDALLLWHNWVKTTYHKYEHENPAMFDALIQEKMLFSNIPLTSEPSEKTATDPKVSQWMLIEREQELDRLRDKLEKSKKTLEKQQKTIQAHEKEIHELKRQINALETIDQKIQEKKNAIPSAESGTQR